MTQNYIERRYADGTYGLGEEVIPNVYLFRAGNHGLTQDELKIAIRRTKQQGKKSEHKSSV